MMKLNLVMGTLLFLLVLAGFAIAADPLYVIGNANITGNITAGTGTVFIDGSNSKIGIGTMSPQKRLHVDGTAEQIILTSTSGYNTTLWSSGAVFKINTEQPDGSTCMGAMCPRTQFSDGIAVDGKVGIGTINPTSLLHVNGSGSGPNLRVRYQGGSNPTSPTGTWVALIENTQDTTAYNGISVVTRWGGSGSKILEAASYWNGASEVYTPIMTVTGDLRVGIGNDAPPAKLTVGNRTSGTGEPTYHGLIQIQGGDDIAAGNNGLEFKGSGSGSGYGWLVSSPDRGSGNVPLSFSSRNTAAAWTERMTLRSDTGNVGINSTNPTSTLYVNGRINTPSYMCGYYIAIFTGAAAQTDTGNEVAAALTAMETQGKTYACIDCITAANGAADCTTAANDNQCEVKITC